jgi:cysteine-rich repeat protein
MENKVFWVLSAFLLTISLVFLIQNFPISIDEKPIYQPAADICNDGLDNDGDGLTDFVGGDLGCWGPTDDDEEADVRENENGWTTFDKGPDTKIIYLAGSGSDSGSCSIDSPCRSLNHGISQLRDGKGDWVLMKRGDSFSGGGTWSKSGATENDKMILGAYGEGPKPDLGGTSFNQRGGFFEHVAWVSLVFDGSGTTHDFITDANDLLFEDLEIYGQTGPALTNHKSEYLITNLEIRRNLVLDEGSKGIDITYVDGLLFEGNILEHNGWSQGGSQSTFNHNVYSKNIENAVIKDNIFSQAPMTQWKARSDNAQGYHDILMENNLFIRGRQQIDFGSTDGSSSGNKHAHNNMVIKGNIFFEPSNPGGSITNTITIMSVGNTDFISNYFLFDGVFTSARNGFNFIDHSGETYTSDNVRLKNNHMYKWDEGDELISLQDSSQPLGTVCDNTEYASEASDCTGEWVNYFELDESNYIEERTLGMYVDKIEGTTGSDTGDFIDKIRGLSTRDDWTGDYETAKVVKYLKDGFTRLDEVKCPNGEIDENEECDDGNTIDTDACTNLCLSAFCGDKIVYKDIEQCDDGNNIDTDECTNSCQIPICGDGVVNPGETCDSGSENGQPTKCNIECTGTTGSNCGNSIIEEGEECDDGNNIDTDTCSNSCKSPVCGDGITNGDEACDSGTDNGQPTKCNLECTGITSSTCGNEIIEQGEQCDPPGESCSNSCSILETPEEKPDYLKWILIGAGIILFIILIIIILKTLKERRRKIGANDRIQIKGS